MKKIIGIIAAIALLTGGAAAFFFLRPSHGAVAIEDVLPVGPVFYSKSKNLSLRIENLKATKFFHDLQGLDYKKLAEVTGIPAESAAEMRKNVSNIFSPENEKIIKDLFGQEMAVAVYGDESLKSFQAQKPEDMYRLFTQLAGNVFVVTRVAPNIAVTEAALKIAGPFSGDFKIDTQKYNGKDINLITSSKSSIKIAYVRFNDVVVMGMGDKAPKAAVDVIRKKQKALSSDEVFAKRIKHFGDKPDGVGFFDIQPIYALLNDQIQQMSKDSKSQYTAAQFQNQLKQSQGFETLVFASTYTDVMTGKADLYFDKNKIDPSVRSFYICPAQDNASEKFVPWDAVYYLWNACTDFSAIWGQYKEDLAMQAQATGGVLDFNQMISSYEKSIGLSIDGDIVPALGKEFGAYLTDVELLGSFPVPKIVIFVQITTRDKAAAVINKLLSLQPNLQPEEESYQGEVIHFIPIPLVESFKISYTFINNYLLLATNTDILKASLDAAKNPDKSIAINNALRGAAGKKNSLFFVQSDRLIAKAIDVIDWSANVSKEAQVQRQAFLTGSKKNLEDTKARDEKLKADIETKKKQLLILEASPEPPPDAAAQKDNLRKDIDKSQKEILANEESAKSLADQIAAYETQAPKDAENRKTLDEFVKPLLKALSNFRYLWTTTVNGDGVLQTTTQVKIE